LQYVPGEQHVFGAGQAAAVETEHFLRPQRGLAAGREADAHPGDERGVGLNSIPLAS